MPEGGHPGAGPGAGPRFRHPGFTEDAPGVPGTPGPFGRLVVQAAQPAVPRLVPVLRAARGRGDALYTFEHSLIPGLLQTEAYARAILETHPDVTEDVVSERLAGGCPGRRSWNATTRRPRWCAR